MRVFLALALLLLAACSTPPPPPVVKVDPTTEKWYGEALEQLMNLNKDAETEFAAGKIDQAAGKIASGQAFSARLLAVPRPTLAAMQAASDHTDLYGRMLMLNRRDGWARLEFQKNVIRWKTWKPATEDTAKRREVAEARIEECDRRLTH